MAEDFPIAGTGFGLISIDVSCVGFRLVKLSALSRVCEFVLFEMVIYFEENFFRKENAR
jgi:hypothetical protein